MAPRISWRVSYTTLTILFLSSFVCLALSPVNGQIFNGNDVVPTSSGGSFATSDILPVFVTNAPGGGSSYASSTAIHGNITTTTTTTTTVPPPTPTVPPPPIPVQPYTTMASGGFPVGEGTPLALPTTPALFPQNISSCSTCYGMFPTLSRCNVIANTDTFPITPNTTYQSLLPFLKCICTFKALDAYPYCIDCFTKTQQLNQLNVLQANHLENYVDAFRQLCGATFNGNKVPDSSKGTRVYFHAISTAAVLGLAGLVFSLVLTL